MSTSGAPAGESNEGRIARSWRLTKASWQVVREDRVILVLALLSTLLGAVGVAVIFGVAGVGSGGAHGHRHLVDGRVVIVALILAYPLMFISTFFNTAIAAAASAGLQGQRLSLSQALAVPAGRVAQLAVWALLATIFGVVLEQLARRLPLAGAILARVVGLDGSRQAADAGKFGDGTNRGTGESEENVVLEHRSGRQIIVAGRAVSPDGQFAQDGLVARGQADRAADSGALRFGIKGELLGIGQGRRLLQGPGRVVEVFQALADDLPDAGKVAHIVGGVAELVVGEGSMVPVGEGQALAQFRAGQGIDEL